MKANTPEINQNALIAKIRICEKTSKFPKQKILKKLSNEIGNFYWKDWKCFIIFGKISRNEST